MPDAEPAPTIVWISSMNSTIFGLPDAALITAFKPLLEVAAKARAGEQRAHVERVDLDVL